MDKKPTAKNWSVNDYDDLLAGVRDAGELRMLDLRGMTPGLAAALDTGSASHRLMSLLDGPEAGEGESALSRIEELLGELVQGSRETKEWQQAVTALLLRLLRVVEPAVAAAGEPPTRPIARGQRSRTRQPEQHPLGG